jgi:hypothetical protein
VAVALPLLTASPASAHPGGQHVAPTPGNPSALLGLLVTSLSVVVAVATALLCGLLLSRALVGAPVVGVRRLVLAASFAAVGGELVLLVAGAHPATTLVWVRLVLTVAAPALLPHRYAAVGAGAVLAAAVGVRGPDPAEWAAGIAQGVAAAVWLGAATLVATATAADRPGLVRRLAPWAAGSGIAVVGTGLLRLSPEDLPLGAPAGRLVPAEAVVLVVLVVLVAIAAGVVLHRRARRRPEARPTRVEVAGLAVAVAFGGVLAATVPTPAPAPPPSGVPLLRSVSVGPTSVPLLVVPHRPGPNLVHTTVPGVSVGVDAQRLTPTAARDGAPGAWALVTLPEGRGRLWVGAGGSLAAVDIDTGHHRKAADLTGPDGPECAGAALGGLLAGRANPLTRCPADGLTSADGTALRTLVGFLAGREVSGLAVLGDGSPRASAAAAVVRAEARRHGLAVTGTARAATALVVVSGWSRTTAVLRDPSTSRVPVAGTYLAPWSLAAPVLDAGSGVLLPLRWDPYGEVPLRYASLVGTVFPGQVPTAAGYAAWRAEPARGPVKLYAAARISIMSHHAGHDGHGGQGWLPGGRLTAVTGPLDKSTR